MGYLRKITFWISSWFLRSLLECAFNLSAQDLNDNCFLIIGLASVYIQSGSHVLLSGPACNPFGCSFCVDWVTTSCDFSPIFSPLVPDYNMDNS